MTALLGIRKRSEAKRIEDELNAKNAAEGKTERVKVKPESVDWLYGTYELEEQCRRRIVSLNKHNF